MSKIGTARSQAHVFLSTTMGEPVSAATDSGTNPQE